MGEQQMAEDKMLKKDKHDGAEVFVTEAFKEELTRRNKFEEELRDQESRDQAGAADKQSHGLGFAAFNKMLLNTGLATSRGGEKIKDLAAAYVSKEELAEKEQAEKIAKDEEIDDNEANTIDVKAETDQVQASGHRVAEIATNPDLQTVSARAQADAEVAANREEKAMTAKERFLARKRAAAEAG